MFSDSLLILLIASCLLVSCGVNGYLAVMLIRGVRVEDKFIETLLNQSKYATRELSVLARLIRKLPFRGQAAVDDAGKGECDAPKCGEEALQAAFADFNQVGFQEIGDDSVEAHKLISEMARLDGKDLMAWRSGNDARLQNVLTAQAGLPAKIDETCRMLDAANVLIHQLGAKNNRLGAADARAKALDGINQSLEAELTTAKNTVARLNAQVVASVQRAETAERELARREAHYREKFDSYVRDRQQLEKEKQAAELRLDSLQRAFDQTVQELNQDKDLRQEHERFLGQTQTLQKEKSALERQLTELQESFDRTLVEKAFIESVLLDFDTTMELAAA